MSESIQPSWFRKLNYTPWRDLLRGRLTGRMDVQRQIIASDLPAAIQAILQRVVKQTRLWPLEKVDVADELIAHFADGIESGQTVEQLIEAFGDERAAAKLIRRAMIRNRPTIWHIKRALIYSFIALFVLYAGLLVRMFIGQPTLKVNYVDLINEKLNHVSTDQRAWPIYRQAILSLKDQPTTEPEKTEWGKMFDARPGNKRWLAMVQWLEKHQRTMELIRQGSEKPVLGFVLGREGSAKDPELWPQSTYDGGTFERDWLISLLLPHLNETRQLAQILDADIAWARERKDGARITADLTAITRLGSQVRQNDDFVVTSLVAISIDSISIHQLDRTLSNAPELISDADLQKLSHLLAIPQQTNQLIRIRGERDFFYDMMQRAYTDDGNGDGRITRAGMEILMSAAGGLRRSPGAAIVAAPVMASRRETRELYDYFMDKAETNFSKPFRDADWNGWLKEFMDWRNSGMHTVRYAPISIFLPSFDRAHFTAEKYLAERDAVVTGMALEAYRRKNGNYPDRLDAMVPSLLPSVPIDPINGQPLHYKLLNGRPLIYSVGLNGEDDGGRVPLDKQGKPLNQLAASPKDGDWILYPQPVVPVENDEESQP